MLNIIDYLKTHTEMHANNAMFESVDSGQMKTFEIEMPYGYEIALILKQGKAHSITSKYHIEANVFRSNGKVVATLSKGFNEQPELALNIISFIEESIEDGLINSKSAPSSSNQFAMVIYNVPSDLTADMLNIHHNSIESWNLVGIHQDSNENEYVANVRFRTSKPCTEDELEGYVSVSSEKYEVMGADIFIDSFQLAA